MTIPTSQELLTEWVAALRSGEYKQGEEFLHNIDNDTYCCLGVACDILTKKGLLTRSEIVRASTAGNSQFRVTNFIGEDDSNDQLLPNDASRYLGLSEWIDDEEDGHYEQFVEDPNFQVVLHDLEYGDQHVVRAVSSLNDTYHYTFEQIADLIEKQMLKKDSA